MKLGIVGHVITALIEDAPLLSGFFIINTNWKRVYGQTNMGDLKLRTMLLIEQRVVYLGNINEYVFCHSLVDKSIGTGCLEIYVKFSI